MLKFLDSNYLVFALVFVVLFKLISPKRDIPDSNLRYTPLGFAALLVALLFLVYEEARDPNPNQFVHWMTYLIDLYIAGYLVRLYSRLHARLQRLEPPVPGPETSRSRGGVTVGESASRLTRPFDY